MASTPLLHGYTLLLVEDDADSREALGRGLRMHGATVIEVPSAQMALVAAEVSMPDIFLIDIEMPEVDGYGLLRALRSLPGEVARTPAVAVTVHNTPQDRWRTLQAGFLMHYAKPAHLDELALRLATLLDSRKGRTPA